MESKDRRKQLEEIFRNVDEDQRQLVDRLISQVVDLEERMEDLKKLKFIAVHPDNPSRQKLTAAAKLFKDLNSSYDNKLRILLSVLKQVESSAQDDLIRALEEFR